MKENKENQECEDTKDSIRKKIGEWGIHLIIYVLAPYLGESIPSNRERRRPNKIEGKLLGWTLVNILLAGILTIIFDDKQWVSTIPMCALIICFLRYASANIIYTGYFIIKRNDSIRMVFRELTNEKEKLFFYGEQDEKYQRSMSKYASKIESDITKYDEYTKEIILNGIRQNGSSDILMGIINKTIPALILALGSFLIANAAEQIGNPSFLFLIVILLVSGIMDLFILVSCNLMNKKWQATITPFIENKLNNK